MYFYFKRAVTIKTEKEIRKKSTRGVDGGMRVQILKSLIFYGRPKHNMYENNFQFQGLSLVNNQ